MLEITPLNGALGARIDNIDLSKPLDEKTAEAVKQAFYEHVALLFRGQDLNAPTQIAFTKHFGEAQEHPLKTRRTVEGYPSVLILENQPDKPGARNDYWHSDISHAECPPKGTILHSKIVPEGKGDTMICNMYAAWDSLSVGMQKMIGGLRAWHSAAATQRRNNLENNDGIEIKKIPDPCLHPVVRTNPETGRKALFVNPHFVTHFEGMTEAESKPLLDYLIAHSTQPENIYRHHWRAGDVLMWDNRATMHYAVRDYSPHDRRLMHRTTAAGDAPV